MSTIYKKFDTVHSFVKYLADGHTTETFKHAVYSDTTDASWTGTKSYADATDLLLYGDRELAQKINAAGVEKLRTEIYKHQTRRQIYSSIVGCAANVPAYIAGAPNSMINYRQQRVRQHVVNVAYNCAVSGGARADAIVRGGAALIAALMKIEASGIRVNLYAVNMDTVGKSIVSYSVRIKTSGQAFDVLKMSYPIAHPSMNRRHKFRFEEITPGIPSGFTHGYGMPETSNEKIIEHFATVGLKLDAAYNYQTLIGKTADQIANEILSDGRK